MAATNLPGNNAHPGKDVGMYQVGRELPDTVDCFHVCPVKPPPAVRLAQDGSRLTLHPVIHPQYPDFIFFAEFYLIFIRTIGIRMYIDYGHIAKRRERLSLALNEQSGHGIIPVRIPFWQKENPDLSRHADRLFAIFKYLQMD
jgi:hypothetical protein